MKFKITGKVGHEHYFIDGKQVTKKRFDREMEAARPKVAEAPAGTVFGSEASWNRPVVSESLGVHPGQLHEVLERDRKRGVVVEYSEGTDGYSCTPVFRSRAEQLRYLKAHGYHNKHEIRG